jgi:hypothetical protein
MENSPCTIDFLQKSPKTPPEERGGETLTQVKGGVGFFF